MICPLVVNKPLMKLKVTILALVIFGMSACTQKTCPTYAKGDAEQPQTEETANV
ncbi:hypothetical protein C7460_101226 [Marinoscillum furvescens DSM 4134]|uniref:Lipoprotein n=1 Tax=Marinoscillum furvescens DSM 4134 TaxID=1122208 RepID=A0A3D9LI51_MARFU|nr:hypothetical protein C7460_101226 [Marinoscillum furvescens DSM 4134]